MLILARKKDQGLSLRHKDTGEVIRVVVVEFRSGRNGGAYQVRVGLDAGDHWNIVRDEIDAQFVPSITQRIQASNSELCELGRK